ncbi:Cdgsh iron sulfur domain-containing protein 2 [Plakobranchus ocellatus]|uniref:CDGSH iron-sulfur domain-containing protein 2 homologue n=1 Tax=Plakobranchus ocellatus TaxID=259542 RepID=A0AAV3ZKC9_9GAST|nr:Cdgsh iron sulfur domain-containing protein 2 [Plakobranchus ocellatus]
MEAIHIFVKTSLPKYLRSLNVPKTFGGFSKLSGEDWVNLVPLVLCTAVFVMAIFRIFLGGSRKKNALPKVNQSIMKEDPKVVTQMDIEDIGEKIAFCRCWRSKKFPLCDGTHNKHNAEANDNVGPLLLRRAEGEK